MKTIGLIGGMSWESSLLYYRIMNQCVKEKLGGHHSAKLIMHSLDFQEIKLFQDKGKWDEAAAIMVDSAKRLETAGAEALIICTNTMHRVAPQVEDAISIPLLHIADQTGKEIAKDGIQKVALLGTAFTMEQDFYKGRLVDRFGLDVMVPDEAERRLVHEIIYQELCLGMIQEGSKKTYLDIIQGLMEKGAQAVILGCTEITLLISQADCSIPVYDTTRIHAESAIDFALR